MNMHVNARTPEQLDHMRDMLAPFRAAGYEIFPLRIGAKIPAHVGWQERQYSDAELRQWAARGGNLGVRLHSVDLIIDADPRRYREGDDPLRRLSEAIGHDLLAEPAVLSGRGDGGRHIYLKKPPDLRIVGGHTDYPGLDFKSVGGLVVAPGSVHPVTGGLYEPDEFAAPIADVADAPAALLALIARPDVALRSEGQGVGKITNEQLADLLAALDPVQFRDHDKWFRIMCACHDATAGHGLGEFLEWCFRDDLYATAAHEEAITRRWNSLTAGKPGGADYRSLLKLVSAAGRPDLVAALGDGDADFDGVPIDLSGDPGKPADDERKQRFRRRGIMALMELSEPLWLVEKLIPETGTGTYYGPPFGGKTYTILDMSLHIALGMPYHGIPVRRGVVVHVAAEGSPARIRDRVLAWCAYHKVDPARLEGWWHLVDVPVHLDVEDRVEAFLDANRDTDGAFKAALVIFDTQARNMIGDENSAKDISKMVAGIDRVREVTGGFALRLHHEGREAKVGGRGSTAGAGADDATYHLKVLPGGRRIAFEVEALRDGEPGYTITFDLVSQEFTRPDGSKGSSAVVVMAPSDKLDELVLRIYQERPATIAALVDVTETGFSKSNVYRLVDKGRTQGLIEAGTPIRLTEAGEHRALELGAQPPGFDGDVGF